MSDAWDLRRGTRSALREVAAFLAVLLAVGVIAAAFVWPWLPRGTVGGPALARSGPARDLGMAFVWPGLVRETVGGPTLAHYAPIRNGEARLTLRQDADGNRLGWESQSARLIPGLRVSTDIRAAPASAIIGVSSSDESGSLKDRLRAIEIVEVRALALELDGTSTMTLVYSYRAADGDHLVAFTDVATDNDIVFDPPPLTLPSRMVVGEHWETSGALGSAQYRWAGQVIQATTYDGPLGQYDDCLLLGTTFQITRADGVQTENQSRDVWCAGVGSVQSDALDTVTGTLKTRNVAITADGALASPEAAPPAPSLSQDAQDQPDPATDLSTWKMGRVGRARGSHDGSEATIPPLWLPTDPPTVLAAGYGGDLVAFDVSVPGSLIRWSFHPEGMIFGVPAFDPSTGRIFFGATDKRLYALDARGLFLWSFLTGDNIATRPLVVGDVVVFGSEDGNVYGLDVATGAQRWTMLAGGAIVSSPARVGNVVVIGSDDQTVYGLDAATGSILWTYAAGGAVEAPIVVDANGTAFVASRSGGLAAVPAAACTASGASTCKATWEEKPGAALRTAPLALNDRVLVVDGDGTLTALSTEDGKRLWTDSGRGYVGAPVAVNDTVIVAGKQGDLYRLTADGERLGGWSAADASSATDPTPTFQYGPTVGGGNLWTSDASAVVRRLGPPLVGDIPSLDLAWFRSGSQAPFGGAALRWTPVEHNGRALLLDFHRQVFAVDPKTGAGERLLTLPGEAGLAQVDPVVSGDTLLTVQEETLQALDLRTRRLLWQVPGVGASNRPPVVSDTVVLWVSGREGQAVLLALDLATGTERWRASLPDAAQGGGAVAGDGVAYVSAMPAAFDLATGARRWQTPLDGTPLGSPALAPDGSTLYAAMLRTDNASGVVVALDARTGAERWRTDTGDVVLRPIEPLWLEEGMLVVPGLSGKIVALDAATGAERWRFSPPGNRLGGVTVARDRVWFMLENARFYALDLETGRPVARFSDLEISLDTQGLAQRPLVAGDRVLMPIGLALLGFDVPDEAP